jgi:protein-S-isoprenylcysteine O-methyltransferase Ste14
VSTEQTDHPGVIARPPLMVLAALGVVLVLRWLLPLPIFPPRLGLVPGLLLAVLGATWIAWGRRTMVAAGTNVNPTKPTTAIVASGPFRYSRNPLYVGATIFYVGVTLAMNTWWGFATLLVLLPLLHFGVVLREERYLDAKFGEPYREYRSRVRRYL